MKFLQFAMISLTETMNPLSVREMKHFATHMSSFAWSHKHNSQLAMCADLHFLYQIFYLKVVCYQFTLQDFRKQLQYTFSCTVTVNNPGQDACATNAAGVCQNGGTCRNSYCSFDQTLDYFCECPIGFTGQFCDIPCKYFVCFHFIEFWTTLLCHIWSIICLIW